MLELDHLAIAATTLEEGCDWVAQRLGTAPIPGDGTRSLERTIASLDWRMASTSK